MAEPVDHEIEAIKVMLAALAPLSEKARASVLDYVTRRLDLAPPATPIPGVGAGLTLPAPAPAGAAASTIHIEEFKEQKHPRSANEMAAVVAFYLMNLAPQDQRKNTINQRDIETQFKIASFPLPQHVRATLPNAKNAGYFDLVGDGEYKLNAVGHNLVAHSMPRGASMGVAAVKGAKRPKGKRGKAK